MLCLSGFGLEILLADSALGTGPVVGKFFEGCSGLDAVLGIADGGVIHPATDHAYIFLHSCQFVFRGE